MEYLSNLSNWRSFLLFALLLLLASHAAVAADVKGTVTNAQGGEPLGKVQVAILGTGFITTTGPDGTFQILQIPPGNYILQASSVGYRLISVSFQLATADETKEFLLTLTPDNFRHTDVVEVRGDLFEAKDWPAVGDLTLTSSEMQQTATVLANDPYRSLQALPGVSASANNDFLAQFSVMGAPYEQIGVYVDDVLVPNLLHTVANVPDAPTLSLLTGNDVEDLRLMPVAYPVRYADASGAALAIRTRTGSEGHPLFHGSVGMAASEFLGEGGFGSSHKGTWLVDARKSYIGYLVRRFGKVDFTDDAFYDASVKLTYNLTPTQTLSFLGTGGQIRIHDPQLPAGTDPTELETGTNDLVITRLGWRWTPSTNLLMDAHAAYVRTSFDQANVDNQLIERSTDREWSGGTNLSWSWHPGMILQAGYSLRRPVQDAANNFFSPGQPPVFSSFHSSDIRQNAYLQHAAQLWKNRFRLEGGLRWSRLDTLRVQPVTGQFSAAWQATRTTQLEAAWGRYAQLPPPNGFSFFLSPLPRTSSQYILAVEQRLGERSRFRIEAFDRQNELRADIFLFSPALLKQSVLLSRDYSRGLQFLLQRRSENRLSGWLGYTLVFARFRTYALPPPFGQIGNDSSYSPTLSDQRHTANLFASYRFKPSVRFSAKALYGSGFPVNTFLPILRLGSYQRLDLRADKSWLFRKWKLSLYGELLNATNHDNRRFGFFNFNPITGQTTFSTFSGLPVTPTAGLAFDF
jgi:hypothetical protein